MVPDPRVSDWKAPGVLWYPARFIKRHEDHERKPNKYEFEWLECNDGMIYDSTDSELPPLMPRMFRRARKFCVDIDAANLSAKQLMQFIQIGKVRMPFYMNPDYPDHENPELAAIFNAALPQIAEMLAASRRMDALAGLGSHAGARSSTCDAIRRLAAAPAPCGPLGAGMNAKGDGFDDLAVGHVVPYSTDGHEALIAMFSAIPLPSAKAGGLATRMMQFNNAHTVYDPHLCPPTFCRELPSDSDPTAAIPVRIKRKGGQAIEGESPSKRPKGKQLTSESQVSEGKKQATMKKKNGKSKAKPKSKLKAKSGDPDRVQQQQIQPRKSINVVQPHKNEHCMLGVTGAGERENWV
ncbi:hypothetical protein B0H13DRAFT_1881663 [Mycena leptocephala]|nr:hypothetical protein B0H13DRAFT_1881663 [Mycena leptocephala]